MALNESQLEVRYRLLHLLIRQMFVVRTVHFESGEQMPLLCRSHHIQPAVLPMIYCVLRRRHKSVNTIRRDVAVLKWLYEWAEDFLDIDLDSTLASGGFEIISRNLEQFSFWLRSGRTANNIAGRVGRPSTADWLHPKTYNDYLLTVQAFLLWAIER